MYHWWLSGNKESVPNVQSQSPNISPNPHSLKQKEEQKQERPKKEEIITEEKSDKEEKEKYESNRMNQMPKQPYMTYMMMYPYGMNNQNDNKPPMMFMIPMYVVDPRGYPNGIPMPVIPNMQFGHFFPFPPYGNEYAK